MSGEMKQCPFCAEMIQAAAKVCRYCGRDLGPGKPVLDVRTRADTKKPIIGLVGILLLLAGACVAGSNLWIGILLLGSGLAVLVYALVTGNIKLFG